MQTPSQIGLIPDQGMKTRLIPDQPSQIRLLPDQSMAIKQSDLRQDSLRQGPNVKPRSRQVAADGRGGGKPGAPKRSAAVTQCRILPHRGLEIVLAQYGSPKDFRGERVQGNCRR